MRRIFNHIIEFNSSRLYMKIDWINNFSHLLITISEDEKWENWENTTNFLIFSSSYEKIRKWENEEITKYYKSSHKHDKSSHFSHFLLIFWRWEHEKNEKIWHIFLFFSYSHLTMRRWENEKLRKIIKWDKWKNMTNLLIFSFSLIAYEKMRRLRRSEHGKKGS